MRSDPNLLELREALAVLGVACDAMGVDYESAVIEAKNVAVRCATSLPVLIYALAQNVRAQTWPPKKQQELKCIENPRAETVKPPLQEPSPRLYGSAGRG